MKATAVLYFNNDDIKQGARASVSSIMRDYCLLKSCRRAYLCSVFACAYDPTTECCDVCCNTTSCTLSSEELVNANLRNCLKQKAVKVITDHFHKVNDSMSQVSSLIHASYLTGLDDTLANDVVESFISTVNVNIVDDQFSYLSNEHKHTNKQLLGSVLSDDIFDN